MYPVDYSRNEPKLFFKDLERKLQGQFRVIEESQNFFSQREDMPADLKARKRTIIDVISEKRKLLEMMEMSSRHLERLVSAGGKELPPGGSAFSSDSAKILWSMHDLEDRVWVLQGMERGVLDIDRSSKAWNLFLKGIGTNLKMVENRITKFLATNDSMWLLMDLKWNMKITRRTAWPVDDTHELMLLFVRNCLRLSQDREGWQPQHPPDGKTELRLQSKYLDRLTLWREQECKLRSLLKELEILQRYWPHHKLKMAVLKRKPNVRRSKSLSHLNETIVQDRNVDDMSEYYQTLPRGLQKASSTSQLHCLALCDIAVEAAFPTSGIIRLPDKRILANREILNTAKTGISQKVAEIIFWAGSSGEGLAMQAQWGHQEADLDVMGLREQRLVVHVPQVHGVPEDTLLVYRPEGCPPAYCKVQVTDKEELERILLWKWDDRFVHRSENRLWLHTRNFQQAAAVRFCTPTVCGPAVQVGGDLLEMITTLVCSAPHPDMKKENLSMHKGVWPSAQQIERIAQLPMLLVLVGHKQSADYDYQARVSWSLCEFCLLFDLPECVKHGYIACKYVLKRFLREYRGQTEAGDGRSRVGSYHLKTVFLRYLQRRPPSEIRSPFVLMLDLLGDLDKCLHVGSLPQAFMPQCDLLEAVGPGERLIASQAIRAILRDPLFALLTAPTDLDKIYGDVHPDTLTQVFQRVSSHPVSEQSRQELSDLLVRLDECRQERFRWQQASDTICPSVMYVSGRPAPLQLACMLEII